MLNIFTESTKECFTHFLHAKVVHEPLRGNERVVFVEQTLLQPLKIIHISLIIQSPNLYLFDHKNHSVMLTTVKYVIHLTHS